MTQAFKLVPIHSGRVIHLNPLIADAVLAVALALDVGTYEDKVS
jgi:hypothetical protein